MVKRFAGVEPPALAPEFATGWGCGIIKEEGHDVRSCYDI
jgi:hypothetical protein